MPASARFHSNLTSILALGAGALLTMPGCGPERAAVALPASTAAAVAHDTQAPAGARITAFAQSIDDAALRLDGVTARFNFAHLDFDHVDTNGNPYYAHVFELSGPLGTDGSATLTSPDFPNYVARLKCTAGRCLTADLEVEKLAGKLAGTAHIRIVTLTEASVALEAGTGAGAATDRPAYLAAHAFAANPYAATLTTTEVVDGRKTLFRARIRFANPTSATAGASTGAFDEKFATFSGELGAGAKIDVDFVTRTGTHSSGGGIPYRADVTATADHSGIVIRFLSDEGLRSVTFGKPSAPKTEAN